MATEKGVVEGRDDGNSGSPKIKPTPSFSSSFLSDFFYHRLHRPTLIVITIVV
jgi:hypothetical protein